MTETQILSILFLTLGLLLALILYALFRRISSFLLTMRFNRARKGEKKSLQHLRALGFTDLTPQTTAKITYMINGSPYDVTVRPDYRAVRQTKSCIIDIKTGTEASNPLNSATRRQLLEYSLINGVDEVYMYDPESKKLYQYSWNKDITSSKP